MAKNQISDLEDHVGYWLRCLSNLIHHSFSTKLLEHNISVEQWVALRTLYQIPNATMNEAANAIKVDKSSLSRMIERLVQRGLVSRTEGLNRRSVKLALTTQGLALVPKLALVADKNDTVFFASLSAQKKKAFLNTIKKLLAANSAQQNSYGLNAMH